MRRAAIFALTGFALAMFLTPLSLPALVDEFEEDPTTDPDWEYFEPIAGSTTSADDGYFTFTFPTGVALDHWSTVDNAVQLRRTDMPDDFIIETRVLFVGSGDPEDPDNLIWPPVNESYQAGLMVRFSQFDMFYWGFYRGTLIRLERSGAGNLCNVDPGLQEVSLQIRKAGPTYSFSWRETDDDPWTVTCERTATQTPTHVGLVFKSWGPVITIPETFSFDYFSVEEVPQTAPTLSFPCPLASPDLAWAGMPYVRRVDVEGFPVPEVTVLDGPPGLVYDPATGLLQGWTPEVPGTFPVRLEAANFLGEDTELWDVVVGSASQRRDDDFDEDPRDDAGFWLFYEPQPGVAYSEVEEDGATWWRMDVPLLGELGTDFDTWVAFDRAPQLQHAVDPEADFLIEARVRVNPAAPPVAANPWLAGLMVNFNGTNNIITWSIGGQRTAPNGSQSNVFAERSGINNICNGFVPDLATGVPVLLRIEKRCTGYDFYYKGENQAAWSHCGSYTTPDQPLSVGLVMKTWGGGSTGSFDFDYFDFVTRGPDPVFTATPQEGTEPLEVVFDATASSSSAGTITAYDWDFGDGATGTGATVTHTYVGRGTYLATLTVTDSTGDRASGTKAIDVAFGSGDVSPWASVDVGDPLPAVEGGARMDGECIRVYAGGRDIVSRADSFHFVHRSLEGDGAIVARLSEAEWNVGAKAGVMIRGDLTPGSAMAFLGFQAAAAGPRAVFVRRATAGAIAPPATTSTLTLTLPDAWAKLERVGGELIGSFSTDGVAWTELGRGEVTLPATAYAGLAATARDTAGSGAEMEVLFCDIDFSGDGPPQGPFFRRGDADAADGQVNITDAIFVLNYLFQGGGEPPCLDAADADNEFSINITDGIYILGFLFLGGPEPPAPGPFNCGPEPDPDPLEPQPLDCKSYPPGC